MKLLVDMGNSRVKWATVSNGMLSQVSSLDYDEFQLQEYWQHLEVPQQVWVSCVAKDEYWTSLSQTTQALWDLQPNRISSPQKGNGVTNGYVDAAKLGSDRWAAMVAAHQFYPTAVCVVDAGTALTVDGLSAEGKHLGGVIVPGVKMMQDSLVSNTATISAIMDNMENTLSASLLGSNTASGIIKGCWLASIGTVEKVYSRLSEQSEGDVVCVLTGGNAAQIAELLSGQLVMEPVVDADLVLKGLAIIAGENITK